MHPCFLCHATKANLMDVGGIMPQSSPKPRKIFSEYEASCDAMEVQVTVKTWPELCRLKRGLFLDSREKGFKGRAVEDDMDDFHFKKGDCLQPSLSVPDTHSFENSPLPLTLTFWRQGNCMTHHRNPLFCRSLHLDMDSCFAVDWLHSCSLGIFKITSGG